MPQEEPGRAGEGTEENLIPQSRFDERVGKERDRAERAVAEAAAAAARATAAEARLREIQEQSKKPEPSVREIAQAVENGQIENPDGIELIVNQTRKQILAEAKKEILAEVDSRQSASAVKQDLAAYVERFPGLTETGSEADLAAGVALRNLAERFDLDASKESTKLLACEQAFGSLSALESAPLPRAGHSEVGGSQGTGGRGGSSIPKQLQAYPKMKAQYDKMISKGLYSGYDDKTLLRELASVEMP